MHAAVIATLPSTAARAYTLTVGGNDMNVGGQSGGAYLVDIDSIKVEEEGPGGISGLSFTLYDPNLEVVIAEGAEVEMWDVTNTIPYFAGFVQSWKYLGILGRYVSINCIGAEVLLDWLIVPSLTIPSGIDTTDAIQMAATNTIGLGVRLRSASTSGGSTQANPIGDMQPGAQTLQQVASVTLAGQTLREAIRLILEASRSTGTNSGVGGASITVDFWWGLRAYPKATAVTSIPSDYDSLTVTDATSGTAATMLDHESDASGAVHAVYVKGGNAAGTGLVTDGMNIPGPVAFIEDSSITTSDARDRVGLAYIAEHSPATRGSLSIESFAPTTNIRAGSFVDITNTASGIASVEYRIASISKSFYANKQTWTVAYGGFRPSFVRQNRRRTRALRS